jgi:hypothetical protein
MSVILNKSQLDHISRLIEVKGVNFYDVKMEMTDHIASEVEELLDGENIEYMAAVKKVFLRYDRFHFMRIEEEQQKKLQKQVWKQFKKGFLQFFTIPKIIITIALFLIYSILIQYVNYSVITIALMSITIVGVVVLVRRKNKSLGKELYIQLQTFNSYLHLGLIPWSGIIFEIDYTNLTLFRANSDLIDPYFLCGASGLLTFFTLFIMVAYELSTNELIRLKNAYS